MFHIIVSPPLESYELVSCSRTFIPWGFQQDARSLLDILQVSNSLLVYCVKQFEFEFYAKLESFEVSHLRQTHENMTAAVAEPVADWTYADRWGMQETIPGLFVGPYAAAKSWDTLALKSISHVLMLRSAEETHLMRPVFPDALRYLTLWVFSLVLACTPLAH